jgi:hypothetical protein
MELTVIEEVFETVQGEWIYRLRQFSRGVTISRVPIKSPLWNHGIIMQLYDRDARKFVPSTLVSKEAMFDTLEQAQSIIEVS